MEAAEKIVLWDSWLRGKSPKEIWRAFGKSLSLFIASWPPVLRRPVETTANSGHRSLRLPIAVPIVGVGDFAGLEVIDILEAWEAMRDHAIGK